MLPERPTPAELTSALDAARELGQIVAQQNRGYDVTKAVPTVVMRN